VCERRVCELGGCVLCTHVEGSVYVYIVHVEYVQSTGVVSVVPKH